MRKRNLLLLLMLTTIWGAIDLQSQVIVVKTKDGERNVRDLNSLQKFSFSNGNLLLTLKDNTTDTYNLTDVNKLYFRSDASLIYNDTVAFNADTTENIIVVTPTSVSSKSSISISLYPNPASSIIQLSSLPAGNSTLAIFRIDGMMVLNSVVSSETNSINISSLRKGLYVVKINGQALKFVKL